jgi:glycosyltransferase involved in cell wall biosynthesis
MAGPVDQIPMPARPPPQSVPGSRPAIALFRAPLFNPSETFIQAQAMAMVRFRPLIVGLESKGHVAPELVDHLYLPRSTVERLAFAWLGRVQPMAERLAPLDPVLVHAHFGTDGVAAVPLARALGVPLVTTLHGFDVSRSRRRLILSGRGSWMRYGFAWRRLMAEGALFLAVSEAVRSLALARGFPAERTVTHRIGVDLGRFRRGGDPEPGLVLHVGRLVEKKGSAVLIEAFPRLLARVPEARLVVVGDGPLRAELERRARRLGLDRAVTFLGERPPGEVMGWMRRAWVLAAPSVTARDGDSEGLPTVIVEAAASSLPAVVSDHSGNAEAVIDGRTGFVTPERDAVVLANRLADVLGSPDLRQAMSLEARRLAERDFDLARQTGLLEDHYDRVLAGG